MTTQAVAIRSGPTRSARQRNPVSPTRHPRRSAHMAGTANAISFVWDGTDVLNEYVPGGLSGRYLTLDGETFAEKRGASRYVYGVDPLGSVVHLLDSGLNRAGTYVYWPYGEVLSHTGVDTPMQYIGNLGYYTATTNRLYVRARWLRVDLGRWMTEDPIGFDGGAWNLYGYAGYAPTCFADPGGTMNSAWCLVLCLAAGPLFGACLDACTTAADMCEYQKVWDRYRKNWPKCKDPNQMADCWNCPGNPKTGFYYSKCESCCSRLPASEADPEIRLCREGCHQRHFGGPS